MQIDNWHVDKLSKPDLTDQTHSGRHEGGHGGHHGGGQGG